MGKAMKWCRAQWLILTSVIFFLATSVSTTAGTQGHWEAEWAKTLAAARKEGRVAIFLFQRDNIEAAVKVFEKQYPEIQVATVSTPAAETAPRIMAERRAGKYLWDICICGPTTPYTVLYPAKVLEPIRPALILPEVLDETKWWGEKHHYIIWIQKGNTSLFFWGLWRCQISITIRT